MLKKKCWISFYGKKLTAAQRIDWILKNVNDTLKANKNKKFEDQKGDAIDVLNEEF